MRILILCLGLVLASCASPKLNPKAYYGEVYSPGTVVFEENAFISTAGVFSETDRLVARKSAYARLMLEALEAGYQSFSIDEEEYSRVLGVTFVVRGDLYETPRTGKGIYPLEAIKRLLQDLPLEEPKPVVKAKPKPNPAVKRPAVRAIPTVAPVQPAQVEEEPLVIMAPEDITGSIRKAGSNTSSVPTRTGTVRPLITDNELKLPNAVSGLPQGVVIRRN